MVRDHVGVDLLLNLTATRRLAPFMRGEHTLGTAAAELQLPASSLAYWVGKFVRAGLVEVVRHEARAGKPIPIYRAASSEFHVPLDAMPAGRRDEFLHGGRRHMFDEFRKSVDRLAQQYYQRGIRIKGHPDRGIELNFIEPDAPPPVHVSEIWGSVALTAEEAAELQRTIEALGERVRTTREGPDRKEYVVVMGLAPRAKR